MKIPGVDRAIVDPTKVRDYLLSDSHPIGRFKAAFFRALGYSSANWEDLSNDLRRHALENDAVRGETNPFGQKFEVVGKLTGPAGRSSMLMSVWIVLNGEDFPRLVTAFPENRE